MRVALVTHSLSPFSGVGRVVSELAKYYKDEMGFDVHVVLPEGEDRPGDYTFHPVPLVRYTWETRNISFFIRSGMKLRRKKFDIVHLHTPCWFKGDVITCHGIPRIGMNLIKTLDETYKKEVSPMYILRNTLSLPLSDYNYGRGRYRKIIALSREMRDFLLSHYKVPESAIELIPNGIDLKEYSPEGMRPLRAPTRQEHGIIESDFVFLFVGNYFKRKGLAFAVEALGRLSKPDAKLLVVGRDVADQARFEEYAREMGVQDSVIFAGESRDTKPFDAAADAFLFPTFYDAYPLANLEAMASGLPIITSRRTGTIDILRDGENGLIVQDPTDIDELSAKMLLLLDNLELRKSMCAEARSTMEQYAWGTICERTAAVYRDILQRPKG